MSTTSSSWQEQAKAFKASINAEIPPEWTTPTHPPLGLDTTRVVHTCGILNPREVDIVQRDATGLRGAIAKGEHTSVEVITAFCKAAAICHQTTNCLVDFFPATALERAKWLDEEYKRTGGSVGPLHGVPISIKGVFLQFQPTWSSRADNLGRLVQSQGTETYARILGFGGDRRRRCLGRADTGPGRCRSVQNDH